MGAIDIAGSSGVHIVGGISGLVGTVMLKPRLGRYESGYSVEMGNPSNAIVGMFMLWSVHIDLSTLSCDKYVYILLKVLNAILRMSNGLMAYR